MHSNVWKIKFESNITQSPLILGQNLKSASWGLVRQLNASGTINLHLLHACLYQ